MGNTVKGTARQDARGLDLAAWGGGYPRLLPLPPQVFVNFAKKQSDNLEQQETSPSCVLQSPLERVLSLLRPRTAPTELRALVVEEQEDLETDDEGLISFEEERVRGCPQIWPLHLCPCHGPWDWML